jgi:hypothetical protein
LATPCPVAFANRPVPPTIVKVAVKLTSPGPPGELVPTTDMYNSSPLAAVSVRSPRWVRATRSSSSTPSYLVRPRWESWQVPVSVCRSSGGTDGSGVTVRSQRPANGRGVGTWTPPRARVAACADDAAVVEASPVQPASVNARRSAGAVGVRIVTSGVE